MTIRVVRLGSPRARDEGLRIGTVRRPPRGVPKRDFARRDFYDVWFPTLAPSLDTMKLGLAVKTDAEWARFARRYRAEMKSPEARHALDLVAALGRTANLAVGCYCADPVRCHRSLLAALLRERGADVVEEPDRVE